MLLTTLLTPFAAAPLLLTLNAPAPQDPEVQTPETPVVQEDAPPVSEIPVCTGDESVLPSGLKYCVMKEGGDAEHAGYGDLVKVHYSGWTLDGQKFDSSRDARFPGAPIEPAKFAVGQVIEGWNEALQIMSPGDQWRIYIPAALAYGEEGRLPQIQPNADLIFEVEVLEIVARAPEFIAWDADAEGITTMENGMMVRVLEEGSGLSVDEASIGVVGFGVFNPGGGLAFAHTMAGAGGGKLQLNPTQPPIPFMKDLMPMMKTGTKLLVNLPSTLGLGSKGSVIKNLPKGSNEIWVIKVDSVRKFTKPEFVLPPEEELTTTESGLKYKILEPGDGAQLTPSSTFVAHYAGWLTDGSPFDNSYDRGEPLIMPLGNVVKGWIEGMQLVKENGSVILVIPPDLGYGDENKPGIPADSTLVFHVELIGVR